jgi:hypothetical protein
MGKNAETEVEGGGERGAILKKGGKGREKWEKMQPQRWKEVEKKCNIEERRERERKMGKNAAT